MKPAASSVAWAEPGDANDPTETWAAQDFCTANWPCLPVSLAGNFCFNAQIESQMARSRAEGTQMRRREFIAGIAAAAVWPLSAHGEQISRVGYLGTSSPSLERAQVDAFRGEMRKLGHIEGDRLRVRMG
jgi:hypothetical protein